MPFSPNLRSRLTKVCVALTGASAEELILRAEATLAETTFLEFRLDYLDRPRAALPALQQFLAAHPTITAVATCRRTADGGRFTGTPADELEILTAAATSGFRVVDLPIEAAELADLARLRSTGVALLLSHHDFSSTPDLEPILERALKLQPDLVKIVPTARTLTDALTLIQFLERNSDRAPLVGISMGDAGLVTRVLGVRAGSLFTFAAADTGEATAPGQVSAHTLLDTFRLDSVDAATKVYGVAGNPVRHSLSPLMLNAAFHREQLNAVYLPLLTNSLDHLLRLTRDVPLSGLSVTMPFKQSILLHLDRTDTLSTRIGACNTVLRTPDRKLVGFNTDVAGILVPLERRLGSLRGLRALVLGAGGAARAAVFGLADKGVHVSVHNRTPETAKQLAKESGATAITRDALRKQDFDILINATSIGMTGHKTASPLTSEDLRAKLVFDLVYNPLETPLLRLARQAGIPVITGAEMFVHQGARQFEIWTGRPAPEEEMLRTVLHTLRKRQALSSNPSAAPATADRTSSANVSPRQPAFTPAHAADSPSGSVAVPSTSPTGDRPTGVAAVPERAATASQSRISPPSQSRDGLDSRPSAPATKPAAASKVAPRRRAAEGQLTREPAGKASKSKPTSPASKKAGRTSTRRAS